MAQRLNRLKTTGFFSIVGAGTLNKVVSFVSGIILVRVLSKSDYGAYSYALNIINYFVLLNGLGTSACVVQLCVERGADEAAAERVYRVTCSLGMLWDLALTVLIVVFALFVPLPLEGANPLLLLLAPFPLFSLAVSFQQERLRSKLMNSQYAISTNVNSVALLGLSVGGAVVGSAAGLSIGRCLAMAISAVLVNRLYRIKVYLRPVRAERGLVVDILKMAVVVCLSNAASQLLVLVGTTIVGSATANEEMVASYATATTIPFALYFLPSMVNTYIAPYFIRHNDDRKWVLRHWAVCSVAVGAFCLCISLACIALSDWMIPFVFGEQYSTSVGAFNILMVAYTVNAVFRIVAGNVIAFHRHYVFNFVANVIALAVAVAATWVLVPKMGIEGAAVGYLVGIMASAVLYVPALLHYAGRPAKAYIEDGTSDKAPSEGQE